MKTWSPSARVVIIVMGIGMIVRATYTVAVAPILESRSKITGLHRQVDELEAKLAPHRRRTLELLKLRRRSVAPDTSLVSLAYQEQLLKHADLLGIDNLSVKPSRPQPLGTVGSVISMSVHASATATQRDSLRRRGVPAHVTAATVTTFASDAERPVAETRSGPHRPLVRAGRSGDRRANAPAGGRISRARA